MKMIDDPTSRREALMNQEETSFAAMKVLWQWIDRYGIPRALLHGQEECLRNR